MFENILLSLKAIPGNELFCPLFVFIFIVSVIAGLIGGVSKSKRREKGILRSLLKEIGLFSIPFFLYTGGFLFLIGMISLPNENYAEIKGEICKSINYDTKETIKEYFNKQNQDINLLQSTKISSDYESCMQQNERLLIQEFEVIKEDFLSYGQDKGENNAR